MACQVVVAIRLIKGTISGIFDQNLLVNELRKGPMWMSELCE
jgi:hypothetical protein